MSLGGPFMSFNHGSWLNWLRERERERESQQRRNKKLFLILPCSYNELVLISFYCSLVTKNFSITVIIVACF